MKHLVIPIIFNSSLVSKTKLRSRMVGFILISFSIGCFFVNLLSLLLKTADELMFGLSCISVILLTTVMILVLESPMWLYKRNKLIRFFHVLDKLSKINNSPISEEFYFEHFALRDINHINFIAKKCDSKHLKHDIDKEENKDHFKGLFFNKKNMSVLFSIWLQAAAMFTCFNGLTINVQDLGIKSIQLNGMTLGLGQMIGYSIITVKAPTLLRKKMSIVILIGEISCAGLLVLIDYLNFKGNEIVQSGLSAALMTIFVGMHFGVTYMLASESFPTQYRGVASASLSFIGNLVGSSAPWLIEVSKGMGLHLMVGCSIYSVLALMFICFQFETFHNEGIH